jgi:hypothetical protein
MWSTRALLAAALIGASPTAFANPAPSAPTEPGWQVLNRAALQQVTGPQYFEDRWLLYSLDVKGSRLVMTAPSSGKRIKLTLSIRPSGQIDDSEGGRSVIQARQGELRMCTVDESPDCWPLRSTKAKPPALTAEEMDQRLKTNAELALEACGAGNVQAVRVNGFSCTARTR